MTRKKKNHYVPKVYLRGFSLDGKRVNIILKKKRIVRNVSISDICQENDYYTQTSSDGKQNCDIENLYSMAEGNIYAPILDNYKNMPLNVINDEKDIFDGLKRFQLLHMILIQLLRGKKSRGFTEKVGDIEFERYRQLLVGRTKLSEKEVKKNCVVLADILLLSRKKDREKIVGPIIKDTVFILLNNKSSEKFITSDEPVEVIGKDWNDYGLFNVSLDYSTMRIFFPISPERGILITRDPYWTMFGDAILTVDNNSVGFVKELNSIQFKQCHNIAIARDRESLDDRML